MPLVPIGPPKLCPQCGFVRPRSDFYGIRGSNGMIYAMSLCKEHTKARVIAWQQGHREHSNTLKARSRCRLKRDPEHLATHRDYQREWARRKRGITPDRYRALRATVKDTASVLDPAPFATWLHSLAPTVAGIARLVGMDKEQVAKYLDGKQRPRIDTVDRALLRAGTATTLDDLYPYEPYEPSRQEAT